MRRSIPRHVVARNRATADAERNALYYSTTKRPTEPPCTRCNKPACDHIFGDCDDLKGTYTPPPGWWECPECLHYAQQLVTVDDPAAKCAVMCGWCASKLAAATLPR